MKKFEEIIKDRLEDYNSPLPQKSLSEFREAVKPLERGSGSRKFRSALLWTGVAAAAACVATVLFVGRDVRQAVPPTEGTPYLAQIEGQEISENAEQSGPIYDILSHGSESFKKTRENTEKTVEQPEESVSVEEDAEPCGEAVLSDLVGEEENRFEKKETYFVNTSAESMACLPSGLSPVQERNERKHTQTVHKALITGGAVAGTAALLTRMLVPAFSGFLLSARETDNAGLLFRYSFGFPQVSYRMPVKTGLSARIPLSDRLFITTGLEHSGYKTTYSGNNSENVTLRVDYLGVPLRVDYDIVSTRWFEAYVGGGIQGDVCIGARLGGEKIEKDRGSISLLVSGGVQFDFLPSTGLYLEPDLSWTLPTQRKRLDTYRSAHPLMFSVSLGLRHTFGPSSK